MPVKKNRGSRRTNRRLWEQHLTGEITPHASALAALSRNPDLAKCNGEHYSQVRVFDWLYRNAHHVYQHTHATPNGGLRHPAVANKMLAEGLKKGYPDVSIDLPCGGYHGMRIELKFGKNRLTAEQGEWMQRLSEAGYYCFEARSAEEAIHAISEYVALEYEPEL